MFILCLCLFYFKNTLNSQGAKKTNLQTTGPKSSSQTVITVCNLMEFPLNTCKKFHLCIGQVTDQIHDPD